MNSVNAQVGPSYDPLFVDLYGPLIPIIITFVILAIVGIIAILYWIKKRIPKRKTNLDILKDRLARGEITKDEFEEMKKSLE